MDAGGSSHVDGPELLDLLLSRRSRVERFAEDAARLVGPVL